LLVTVQDLPATRLTLQVGEARVRLDLAQVDYEATMVAKMGIARQVFDLYGSRDLLGAEYKVGLRACLPGRGCC
jgi:hypothetical protein